MLTILRRLYFEILDDRRNLYAKDEEIDRQFIHAVENEIGLPPIVGEVFLKVMGYTYNDRDLARLWKLVKGSLYIQGSGWKDQETACKDGSIAYIVERFRAGN